MHLATRPPALLLPPARTPLPPSPPLPPPPNLSSRQEPPQLQKLFEKNYELLLSVFNPEVGATRIAGLGSGGVESRA